VHFLQESTRTPAEAGDKALARSLSDIAAMGGEPRLAPQRCSVAPWTTEKWMEGFYDGLIKLAAEFGVVLAGGYLAKSNEFSCDVMVLGAVPRGSALLRSGAKPGHDVYVSGELGGSALGLSIGKARHGSDMFDLSRASNWREHFARSIIRQRRWI
jgi:thiamine-monophosphate kinase